MSDIRDIINSNGDIAFNNEVKVKYGIKGAFSDYNKFVANEPKKREHETDIKRNTDRGSFTCASCVVRLLYKPR